MSNLSFLRLPKVAERVGLSTSSIERKVRSGEFPAPRKIGEKAVAWRSDEIEEWIASRPQAERIYDTDVV